MGTRWSSTRTNTGAEIDNGATRTGACSHCSFGANFHGATSEKAVYLTPRSRETRERPLAGPRSVSVLRPAEPNWRSQESISLQKSDPQCEMGEDAPSDLFSPGVR